MKMRYLTILLIGVAGFLVAANPARDDAKKDKDLFQGTWKAVSGEMGGQEMSEDALKQANVKLTFKEDKYTYKGASENEEGKIKLNPDKKPKAIDFIIETGNYKGKTQLGIYIFEDGKLKICVAHGGDTERPAQFKTKNGGPESLFVFEKQEK